MMVGRDEVLKIASVVSDLEEKEYQNKVGLLKAYIGVLVEAFHKKDRQVQAVLGRIGYACKECQRVFHHSELHDGPRCVECPSCGCPTISDKRYLEGVHEGKIQALQGLSDHIYDELNRMRM